MGHERQQEDHGERHDIVEHFRHHERPPVRREAEELEGREPAEVEGYVGADDYVLVEEAAAEVAKEEREGKDDGANCSALRSEDEPGIGDQPYEVRQEDPRDRLHFYGED